METKSIGHLSFVIEISVAEPETGGGVAMNDMAKTRWGIIGCADFARRRAIPAMLAAGSVELVGIASRSREKAVSFRAEFQLPKAYDGYESLLRDPEIDAVYIPLPNGMHAEWAVKAAEAGKHSLCEKPFACSLAEAERAAAAASSHGVQTAEAFMWRYHAQHRRARAVIDAGGIGPVRLIRAGFSFMIERKPNVRLVPELGGGSLMDLGCYTLSAARFYFSEEPGLAFARSDPDPDFGVDMKTCALLVFPSGRALMDCSFDLPSRRQLEICGEKGTITFAQPWQPEPEAVIYIDGVPERMATENQYVTMFEHVSHCFAEGKAPQFGTQDAILQARALDAIRRSTQTGLPEAV